MKYEDLLVQFKTARPLILLRAKNAPFILSFFYKVFKEGHITTISNTDLRNKLEGYLEDLDYNERDEELEANTLWDDYSVQASQYVEKWSNAGFLSKYPDDNGEDLHELTSDSQKAINWIEDLRKPEFIGTNSRFKDIFFKLKEMIERSNADAEIRVAELEKKKWEIENEINLIRNGKAPVVFDDTDIKERFYDLNKMARELLSDFTEVEQNFDQIRKEIQRKYTERDVAKGTLLVYALDALDEIENKHQGKSFKAFWEFLMDDRKQQEFTELAEKLYQLLNERNIEFNNDRFLKHLKRYLHASGRKVIDSNKRLSEKISKVLSEKNLLERRRALELIGDIRHLAFLALDSRLKDDNFVEFEDEPYINLVDRWELDDGTENNILTKFPEGLAEALQDKVDLKLLFSQFAMDKRKLQQKIDDMLKERTQVTLKQIVDHYGIEKGLTEIVGYFSIAAGSSYHIIFSGTEDPIWIGTKKIILPMIMYSRPFKQM